jgi:hypothetical protein
MSHDGIGEVLAGLDVEIDASCALLIGDLDQCAARHIHEENVDGIFEAQQDLAAQIINAGLALEPAFVPCPSVYPDPGFLVFQPRAECEGVVGHCRIGPLSAHAVKGQPGCREPAAVDRF